MTTRQVNIRGTLVPWRRLRAYGAVELPSEGDVGRLQL